MLGLQAQAKQQEGKAPKNGLRQPEADSEEAAGRDTKKRKVWPRNQDAAAVAAQQQTPDKQPGVRTILWMPSVATCMAKDCLLLAVAHAMMMAVSAWWSQS